MNEIPWIELAILIAAVGAVCVGALRQSDDARRWGLAFSGAAFLLALAGAAQFTFATGPGDEAGNWFTNLVGRQWLGFDRLNAPLLPLVALLYFLTILATQRTKVRRFSFAWTLATSAIALAALACREPWGIIALLCAETMFPFLELRARGKPTRVYVLHMAAFVGLLVLGWSTAPRICSARVRLAAGTSLFAYKAVTPQPCNAGRFGMQRTTATPPAQR
jgi:NADH-quinone oxidoreductase subunit M